MLIGYARVSTADQNLHLQNDALLKAGCERVFEDRASGAKTQRDGLDKAMELLRKGDTLVVWKLDRLGRSLKHLVETVQALQGAGIGFKSLQENLDTTSSGSVIFQYIDFLKTRYGGERCLWLAGFPAQPETQARVGVGQTSLPFSTSLFPFFLD